jgi:single-strand DNA-binding protein
MLNQCQFIGNLGADPETRSFANGGQVCNLRLAVTKKWKDKSTGERKEATEWIPVAIFSDGLVRVASEYLRKGSKVFVQGEFRTRKWQDQSGNDRYSTECVLQGPGAVLTMLDSAQGGSSGSQGDAAGGGWQQSSAPADDDDDFPPF